MRIVAGTARGRTLRAPKGQGIRPTADRVRQAIFDTLGQWTTGDRVLDLYAGTGALGLEALSRGAQGAVLVDSGPAAAALCRDNAQTLGFSSQVEILQADAAAAIRLLDRRGDRFDLVFADPPYAARACADVLALLATSGLVVPGGRVVVEHGRKEAAPTSAGALRLRTTKRFGDTAASFYEPG